MFLIHPGRSFNVVSNFSLKFVQTQYFSGQGLLHRFAALLLAPLQHFYNVYRLRRGLLEVSFAANDASRIGSWRNRREIRFRISRYLNAGFAYIFQEIFDDMVVVVVQGRTAALLLFGTLLLEPAAKTRFCVVSIASNAILRTKIIKNYSKNIN